MTTSELLAPVAAKGCFTLAHSPCISTLPSLLDNADARKWSGKSAHNCDGSARLKSYQIWRTAHIRPSASGFANTRRSRYFSALSRCRVIIRNAIVSENGIPVSASLLQLSETSSPFCPGVRKRHPFGVSSPVAETECLPPEAVVKAPLRFQKPYPPRRSRQLRN